MSIKFFFRRISTAVLQRFSGYQILAIVALIVYAFFFGDSSLFFRWNNEEEIRNLKKQIEYYEAETKSKQERLNQLNSNAGDMEKYAREKYFMKKENEDVFVLK